MNHIKFVLHFLFAYVVPPLTSFLIVGFESFLSFIVIMALIALLIEIFKRSFSSRIPDCQTIRNDIHSKGFTLQEVSEAGKPTAQSRHGEWETKAMTINHMMCDFMKFSEYAFKSTLKQNASQERLTIIFMMYIINWLEINSMHIDFNVIINSPEFQYTYRRVCEAHLNLQAVEFKNVFVALNLAQNMLRHVKSEV